MMNSLAEMKKFITLLNYLSLCVWYYCLWSVKAHLWYLELKTCTVLHGAHTKDRRVTETGWSWFTSQDLEVICSWVFAPGTQMKLYWTVLVMDVCNCVTVMQTKPKKEKVYSPNPPRVKLPPTVLSHIALALLKLASTFLKSVKAVFLHTIIAGNILLTYLQQKNTRLWDVCSLLLRRG